MSDPLLISSPPVAATVFVLFGLLPPAQAVGQGRASVWTKVMEGALEMAGPTRCKRRAAKKAAAGQTPPDAQIATVRARLATLPPSCAPTSCWRPSPPRAVRLAPRRRGSAQGRGRNECRQAAAELKNFTVPVPHRRQGPRRPVRPGRAAAGARAAAETALRGAVPIPRVVPMPPLPAQARRASVPGRRSASRLLDGCVDFVLSIRDCLASGSGPERSYGALTVLAGRSLPSAELKRTAPGAGSSSAGRPGGRSWAVRGEAERAGDTSAAVSITPTADHTG